MFYCAGKLIENWNILESYFLKAIDHTFYRFTGVITHLRCWENTRNACKSLAFGSWFTSFSRVLPTSRVGYHAGKPIENVVYCLNNSPILLRPHRKRPLQATHDSVGNCRPFDIPADLPSESPLPSVGVMDIFCNYTLHLPRGGRRLKKEF